MEEKQKKYNFERKEKKISPSSALTADDTAKRRIRVVSRAIRLNLVKHPEKNLKRR